MGEMIFTSERATFFAHRTPRKVGRALAERTPCFNFPNMKVFPFENSQVIRFSKVYPSNSERKEKEDDAAEEERAPKDGAKWVGI